MPDFGAARRVTADSLHAIADHALETYPDECCGLVVEHADGGQTVVRIRL
jgi:proteasome lid subunit RPN8/RPN11